MQIEQGRKVIINADDFGLSLPVNKAIIKAHREGVLTSTSLLVNMPGFEDAVSLLKENGSLSVGIHINIFRGNPVSSPQRIRSLCEGGTFAKDFFKILGIGFYQRIDWREFEIECRSQIEKALSSGVAISHLDSEKHIHLLPGFFERIAKIAKEYGIKRVRIANEMAYNFLSVYSEKLFNARFYSLLFHSLNVKKQKEILASEGIRTSDYFYGFLLTGKMGINEFEHLLSYIKGGLTEIMCHPFYELELKALLDTRLKDLIAKNNIMLTNYSEL